MDERRAAKRAQQEGESFRLLAENVKDYAIFLTDLEGRIETWTSGAERLLGYREEEIIGQPSDIFFTAEDLERGAPEQERLDARTLGRGEDDRWHVRKDGSWFWSSGVMTPLWDEEGTLRGFAKIMRDRTEWKQAEAARRESDARKAAVLEAALDGIITINQEDEIIEFNPAAERMFGYRKADVLGRKMAEVIIPPRLREAHRRGMAHYVATGEGPVLGERIKMPAMRSDGTEFPIELAIVRVPLKGAPLFTGYARDITELESYERRRLVQLRITYVLAEASTIQEAAPRILEAICGSLEWDVGGFWLVDGESKVLRCLDVWHQPDVPVGVFVEQSRDQPFAEGSGLPGRAWSSGEPLWIPDVSLEQNFPRLRHATEAGLHAAFAVPILLGPHVLGVVEFFSRSVRAADTDLLKMLATIGGHIGQFVERKMSEHRLQEAHNELEIRVAERTAELDRANQFLQALLESLHDGIVACDADGNLTLLNRAALEYHGFPQELVSAPDWVEHYNLYEPDGVTPLSPEDVPLFRAVQGERVHNAEMVIATQNGPKRKLLASGQAFYDEHGKKLGAVVSMHDITQRERAVEELRHAHQELERRVGQRTAELAKANESLKEADRRKDEFLAMLAHELRNPLTPIRTGLDLLALERPSGGEKIIELMQQQISHVVRLVDDLLDVSRIVRGKIDLQIEPVELTPLIYQSAEAIRSMMETHQQELTVSVPEEPIFVDADAVRVVQIIGNLLNNASKYTESGGRIDLMVERDAATALVTVRDTGVGIEEHLLPTVFDLFTQCDRSLDRAQGGLGIGLTLVKQLVEMHGGTVSAHSDGPGTGSAFSVQLPVAKVAAQAKHAIDQPSVVVPRSILVVDDNEGAAWMLSMLLKKLGDHQIDVAHDGHAALVKIQQNRPEIVLLDIGLPGMDGYEVGRAVRQVPELDEILLIAMTGYGQEEDRRKSKQAGFDEHLTKPPSVEQMRWVVAHPKLPR